MKVHAGVAKDSGLIYSLVVIAVSVHKLTPASEFLDGDEEAGYQRIAKRPDMASTTAEFSVAMRPGKCRACQTHQMDGCKT